MSLPKLSIGYSQYGADMGRRKSTPDDRQERIRFRLVRMYLDSGGYDEGGAYWGHGDPLYRAFGEGPVGVNELFVRGKTRDEAKAKIREYFPNASFWR